MTRFDRLSVTRVTTDSEKNAARSGYYLDRYRSY